MLAIVALAKGCKCSKTLAVGMAGLTKKGLQVQQNPGSGNGWTHKSVFPAVKIVLLCPMVCTPCLQRSRIGAGVAKLP
jgi:hypothetical protein